MARTGLWRKAVLFAGLGMFALMAGGEAQAQKAVMTIHPGKGVGGLSLGDGAAQFEAVFPKTPGGWNHGFTGGGKGCAKEFYYWNNRVHLSSDVKAYMMGKQISLITVSGPKFALSNGIVPLYWPKDQPVGTSMKQVEQAYPDGHLYSLSGTDSDRVNGRDLQFWVDRKAGIAFQLVWVPSVKQRMVQKIDVFAPGTAYLPRGCITMEEKYTEVR